MNYKRFKVSYSVGLGILGYVLLVFVITLIESQYPEGNIKNFSDALWYTIVTLTTVGYGDYYPVSPIGRLLGLIVIISSLGVLGYLIGKMTNLIQNYMKKKSEGYYGVDYENHFILIGWDQFSKQVANQLVHANKEVVIVTDQKTDIALINGLFDGYDTVFVLFMDLNNYEGYEKVNIKRAKKIFVNIGSDTELLVFTINLNKQYSDLDVMVSLDQADLKETFHSIGVKDVISKNEIAAKLVASYIFEPDVALFTDDLITTAIGYDDCDMQEYKVVAENPFLNSTYIDAFIRMKKEYDTILLGLVKVNNGERILLKNPASDVKIEENDYVLVISDTDAKQILKDKFNVKEGVID